MLATAMLATSRLPMANEESEEEPMQKKYDPVQSACESCVCVCCEGHHIPYKQMHVLPDMGKAPVPPQIPVLNAQTNCPKLTLFGVGLS